MECRNININVKINDENYLRFFTYISSLLIGVQGGFWENFRRDVDCNDKNNLMYIIYISSWLIRVYAGF